LKIAKPSKSYSEDHETAARQAGIQRINKKEKKSASFFNIFFFGKSFFFRERFDKFDATWQG